MNTATATATWTDYYKAQNAVLTAVKRDVQKHTAATLAAVRRAEANQQDIYRILRGDKSVTVKPYRRLAF